MGVNPKTYDYSTFHFGVMMCVNMYVVIFIRGFVINFKF